MTKNVRILAINPGSTSTKIAVYDNEKQLFQKNIKHAAEDISKFNSIADQYEFRYKTIIKELENNQINIKSINVVMGRGGLIKPIVSGVYRVNDLLLEHLKMGYSGQHACNLGGLIAKSIADYIGIKDAYIADPVVVDELEDIARISGHPLFERRSIFHALNQKAIAKIYAKDQGKAYQDLNLIVVHLGGGVSIGAHCQGKVIDVNQALDGEGPFSPERSGTLPVNQLVDVCFSGKYSKSEVKKMIVGQGGLVGYLGTNDAYEVEKRAASGDQKADFIESAMAYQVGKAVGEAACVLRGKIDAILLTGGIAYGKPFVSKLKSYIEWIAPIAVYPGEDEMGALAFNALQIETGEAKVLEYK